MNINTARTFQKIGFIFVIIGVIVDLVLVPETLGLALILCIVGIIGVVKLSKFGNYSDQEFIEKKGTLLVWGIVTIFTSLLGGILTLVAYFSLPDSNTSAEKSTGMTLEKAFKLKKEGALTDKEYQEIKSNLLNK